MKTPSGTFPLKLVVLATTATALFVLISACKKSLVQIEPTDKRPIVIVMDASGVKTTTSWDLLKNKCRDFNAAGGGEKVCEIAFYDNTGREVFHEDNRSLTMTRAVRSDAAASSAAADPVNVTQKVAFATPAEAAAFLGLLK